MSSGRANTLNSAVGHMTQTRLQSDHIEVWNYKRTGSAAVLALTFFSHLKQHIFILFAL